MSHLNKQTVFTPTRKTVKKLGIPKTYIEKRNYKGRRQFVFYTDDNGNILDMRTPLGDALEALLDEYYDMLSKMTAEQRMNYFKYERFVEPLRYTQDVDNTTYIVRTHFDQNADKTILQRVENIVEKSI